MEYKTHINVLRCLSTRMMKFRYADEGDGLWELNQSLKQCEKI